MSQTKKVGKAKLSVFGGQCDADQVLDLLNDWPDGSGLEYRIWEYTDAIEIVDSDKLPEEGQIEFLERARLFGTSGDLSLRRVGEKFHWWFIGPRGINIPKKHSPNNFWGNGDSVTSFNQESHTALLWGKREKGKENFWEDRVAGANLDYPAPENAERVQVEYYTYSHAGRVEFVWMRELSEWQEEENDG